MKFGVSIIYYNPSEVVLKRLEEYSKIFNFVFIADNSDNPKFDVRKELLRFPNVTYLSMKGNMGMSKAISASVDWANDNSLDFLLTLDQDSLFDEINIRKMIDFIEANDDSSVGIYVANERKIYKDRKTGLNKFGKYCVPTNQIKSVSFCLTSTSFIRIKAINKIMPLTDYFISYVDNFISYGLIEEGYKLLKVGNVQFNQQIGESVYYNFFVDKLRIIHHKEIRYYYMARNNRYFNDICKERKLKFRNNLLFFHLILNIFLAESNKFKKIKAIKLGIKDYKNKVYGKLPDTRICW